MDTLADALYRRFVLRDWFGKIVPGWIALSALARIFDTFPGKQILLGENDAVRFAIGAGVAWLFAFGMQQVGEWTHYLHYWTPQFKQFATRYQARITFLEVSTPDEKQQLERLLVIKESTGLASMALLMVAALWGLYLTGVLVPPVQTSSSYLRAGLICALAGAFVLRGAHTGHCRRQYDFKCAVLRHHGRLVPAMPEYAPIERRLFSPSTWSGRKEISAIRE